MSGTWVISWILPWLVSALATLHLVLVRPAWVPAVCALALLAWTAFRHRSVPLPRYVFWLLLLPFAMWWVVLAIAGSPRPEELLAIIAWYLLLLSLSQILAGPRVGGWRTWNALAAVLLTGFHPESSQFVLVGAIAVLVLLQSRMDAARTGSVGFRPAWIAALLPVAALAFAAQWFDVSIPLRGFDHWRPPTPGKGFSSTLRLGGGFGLDPDPSDDEVVLRVWSERAPRYMKGAVFDGYAKGYWSRSEGWTMPASSRNHLEFSVFCQESDTMAPPSGWASSSASTEGYLLVPPEEGCVGVVADTIERAGSGIWRLRAEGLSRGWMWFPGTVPQRVRESERTIPKTYAGFVDSAFAASGAAGLPPRAALARMGAWMASDFRYSLQVREKPGEDPMRAFLRNREGYCEHFASLGALLARRAGIPSRVATGYASPEVSAGAWLFRRSNAHAWVEVFLPGRGWTTWDPTPAGDGEPSRRGFLRRWSDGFGTRMTALWHGVRDGAWRSAMSGRLDSLSDFVRTWWLWALLVLVPGAGVLVAIALGRRRRGAEEHELASWRDGLARAEARLRREGFVRDAGETVGAFLSRLPDAAHGPSREFLDAYQCQRWTMRKRG